MTKGYPEKLQRLVDMLAATPERADRIETLVDIAGRFREVPEDVAKRPFPNDHMAPACESQAYVWATPRGDGTLDFHFAVENPQGIAARALSVILGDTLSGAPPEDVAQIPDDVVYEILGEELSMGKSTGLMGIVAMVRNYARKYAADGSPMD
jgi:cysteine desulfuration protein SufE